MKHVILGSLVILNIMNPPLSEEPLRSSIEFKNKTAQTIDDEEMVFPFEVVKDEKNVKDSHKNKKIDFFAEWKAKIKKTSEASKAP
tara:strand:- start:791 stop:1048 length:258 start_codon:yes stop_codon:yes gene_type:complete